jgi:Mlc titration factor MtfA (ptsG expression regulator)
MGQPEVSERRAELVAVAPRPFRALLDEQTEQFLVHAQRLVDRVSWEPARGVDLTDRMVLAIAAHAAMLVAGFPSRTDPYRDVTAVVVHGGTIVTNDVVPGPVRGVVSDAPRHLAGQAGPGRGPIVLDWRTAEREFRSPELGTNVVFHEFAHKLDQLDGVFDGAPPLASDEARAVWQQTLGTNYRRLKRRGYDPLVRVYAATNEVEYFAVVTELFFTVPERLLAEHRRVYERLAEFFQQDPARRFGR